MVERLLARPPAVLALGKQAFYEQLRMPLAEAYRFASATIVGNMLMDEAEEGIGAFIEKRKPNWSATGHRLSDRELRRTMLSASIMAVHDDRAAEAKDPHGPASSAELDANGWTRLASGDPPKQTRLARGCHLGLPGARLRCRERRSRRAKRRSAPATSCRRRGHAVRREAIKPRRPAGMLPRAPAPAVSSRAAFSASVHQASWSSMSLAFCCRTSKSASVLPSFSTAR